jgi:hypothetical protein
LTVAIHRDLAELARRVTIVDAEVAILDDVELRAEAQLPLGDGASGDASARAWAWPETSMPSVSWLAMQLYGRCYIRPVQRSRLAADAGVVHAFQLALSTATRGHGTWEPGWRFESDKVTHHIVSWHGVRFAVAQERMRPNVQAPTPGSPCEVRVPNERRNLYRGYYFLVGDETWPVKNGEAAEVLRVYWNVTSSGAPPLVTALSRELNRESVPFLTKIRNSPDGHGRADSAILYLPRDRFPQARECLSGVHAEVEDHLVAEVPMLTKHVAPGVGIAEDPDNGLSFGQHRCELVTRGLWKAHLDQRHGWQSKCEAIAEEFRQENLDVIRPYLSAGSHDVYRLSHRSHPTSNSTRRREVQRPSSAERTPHTVGGPDGDAYLRASVQLGDVICANAYWNRPAGRCNWLGRTPDLTAISGGTPRPLAASLGPDIYNGQAGIALFLAELFAQTADETFRKTALGALEGAHHQLRRDASVSLGPGLYTGTAGIAYATWRVTTLTRSDKAMDATQQMLAHALASSSNDRDDDIISGRAGVIMALLALSAEAGWASCLERATELGKELIQSLDARAMLTGLAHGAAGYGSALLALYSRTRMEEFLRAGRGAFAYEDSLFDEAAGNWPDLRKPLQGAEGQPARRFVVTWCNGAAGIALSRLHAITADPARSEEYARQARIALAGTQKALRSQLNPEDDTSLCHGSGGLIETLLQGSLILNDEQLGDQARIAIDAWLEQRSKRQHFSHQFIRANPSLMLGAAGMGHQLLRMHAPGEVRPVLAGP